MENEKFVKELLGKLRDKIRVKNYSIHTEKSYRDWAVRYIMFHGKRHPSEMGKIEIEQFLTHMAVEKNVSPSTQNQALAALIFFYGQVLDISLEDSDISAVRAKSKIRIPVVLTKEEVKSVIEKMDGVYRLIAALMYGTGMRVMEVLRLRVCYVDFGNHLIHIYDSKSEKDRISFLPDSLLNNLREYLVYCLQNKRI